MNVLRTVLEVVVAAAWAFMLFFVLTWAPDILTRPPWRLAALLGGFVALGLSSYAFRSRRVWFDWALAGAAIGLVVSVQLVHRHWPLTNPQPRMLLSRGFVNYLFWPWLQTAVVLLAAAATRIAGGRSRA